MRAHPKWNERKKVKEKNRLVWFKPKGSIDWFKYWQEQITKDYYKKAQQHPVNKEIIAKTLLKFLNKKGKHIEAGCGAGYWVEVLRNHGYDIVGIELDNRVVELAKSINPALPIEYGDAMNINVPDSYFDSYISLGVIEHRRDGPEPFLEEAFRVLKKNGIIVVTVPNFGIIRRLKAFLGLYSKPGLTYEFYQYGFTKKELRKILEQSGFTVLATYYQGQHRLLMEECSFYRILMRIRGSTRIKKLAEKILMRFDGHMLLIVGQKNA